MARRTRAPRKTRKPGTTDRRDLFPVPRRRVLSRDFRHRTPTGRISAAFPHFPGSDTCFVARTSASVSRSRRCWRFSSAAVAAVVVVATARAGRPDRPVARRPVRAAALLRVRAAPPRPGREAALPRARVVRAAALLRVRAVRAAALLRVPGGPRLAVRAAARRAARAAAQRAGRPVARRAARAAARRVARAAPARRASVSRPAPARSARAAFAPRRTSSSATRTAGRKTSGGSPRPAAPARTAE